MAQVVYTVGGAPEHILLMTHPTCWRCIKRGTVLDDNSKMCAVCWAIGSLHSRAEVVGRCEKCYYGMDCADECDNEERLRRVGLTQHTRLKIYYATGEIQTFKCCVQFSFVRVMYRYAMTSEVIFQESRRVDTCMEQLKISVQSHLSRLHCKSIPTRKIHLEPSVAGAPCVAFAMPLVVGYCEFLVTLACSHVDAVEAQAALVYFKGTSTRRSSSIH